MEQPEQSEKFKLNDLPEDLLRVIFKILFEEKHYETLLRLSRTNQHFRTLIHNPALWNLKTEAEVKAEIKKQSTYIRMRNLNWNQRIEAPLEIIRDAKISVKNLITGSIENSYQDFHEVNHILQSDPQIIEILDNLPTDEREKFTLLRNNAISQASDYTRTRNIESCSGLDFGINIPMALLTMFFPFPFLTAFLRPNVLIASISSDVIREEDWQYFCQNLNSFSALEECSDQIHRYIKNSISILIVAISVLGYLPSILESCLTRWYKNKTDNLFQSNHPQSISDYFWKLFHNRKLIGTIVAAASITTAMILLAALDTSEIVKNCIEVKPNNLMECLSSGVNAKSIPIFTLSGTAGFFFAYSLTYLILNVPRMAYKLGTSAVDYIRRCFRFNQSSEEFPPLLGNVEPNRHTHVYR